MEGKPSRESLAFGLDIGIASVGWSVLAPNRILALGVRAFDKAETAKEGESLNLARRTARLMRRRLRRRAWRLTRLARALTRHGVIPNTQLFRPDSPTPISPWTLRVQGLDRLLAPDEWARVIYHLCKHRGFHWISRAEERKAETDAKGEGGKVKQGLAATSKLMKEKGYRTAAEMVLAEFPEAQRNKHGDYGKALSRVLLGEELVTLFKHQRQLGNSHATEGLEAELLGSGDRKTGIFWTQKPALAGVDLLKMLGKCTFERSEYRAPKASFTAERHVWLTRLNNLRIVTAGTTRGLNELERRVALTLPYEQATDLTYKQLRAALTKGGCIQAEFRFAGFSYAQQEDGKAKDPEAAVLTKLPAWQEIRLAMKRAGLETEWKGMAAAAIDGDPTHLDEIARVLSVFKEDDEAGAELRKLGLPGGDAVVNALLDLRFDKFHALSLKALRKIVPFMEAGLRYDEACERAGFHHSQIHKVGEGNQKYLPPLYSGREKDGRMKIAEDMDVPRNPVVLRALNQARKVVNALVRQYGPPDSVHIEMARDLSRPLDERNQIKKEQEQYRERNEKDKTSFAECFGQPPKGAEFEKWRLYREQQGKCAYSLKPLDLDRLLERGYVEVDHALPYSRSFDDSKNNKVLVLGEENRNKGNRTPYEYLGGAVDSERWRLFSAYVESNKAYRLAKRSRLLRKEFGGKESEEFRERNLNDTRYICRFFKNYVEQYLQLAEGSESKRCVVLSGQLTSFLRARWGLVKVRDESDRHHALDATVVAACSHGMVKRLSDYARRRELSQVRDGFADVETGEIIDPAMFQQLREHFPEPWPHFRHELEARLKQDDPSVLRAELAPLGTYPDAALQTVRPLFVSRAPQRRNLGAAHKDTIYSRPSAAHIQAGLAQPEDAIQRVPVERLSASQINDIVGSHDGRNTEMIEALRSWLLQRDDREKQAKAIEAGVGRGKDKRPLTSTEQAAIARLRGLPRKPTKSGEPGPVIRSVKVNIGKKSGISVRNGFATNDAMLRLRIYAKDGRHYLVPVYVHHLVTGMPNRAIVAYKDESQWTLIDESYEWLFDVYPNDLVRVVLKGQTHFGYYAGCNRSTGAINLWAHDRSSTVGKDGLIESIGIKTAISIEKFDVDVLGNVFRAKSEGRVGLA